MKRHPVKAITPDTISRMVAAGKKAKRADGNGLYLIVQANGRKAWYWRAIVAGRRKYVGCGGDRVSLEEARAAAAELSQDLRQWRRKELLDRRRGELFPS